jgi:anion-transporting  ArsA/GET3 family ATPase
VRQLLTRSQVIVCLGPGGVGKTTTAAAIALAGARRGRRAVVLTIDPAHRLADAVGLSDGLTNEPRQLDGAWSGELWAAMLDPRVTFEAIINAQSKDSGQAERILSNRLFQHLTSSLSGTNEFMASERLLDLHLDPRFDLVVIDTPPSRHAVDFLDSPDRLVRFVDHRLYRTVLAPQRGLRGVMNAAGQMAVRTMGRVVGSDLLTDVIEFFNAFQGMDEGFRQRASRSAEILRSAATGYVLVTSPRSDPIDAARWLATAMADRQLPVALVIANRLTPQELVGPHRIRADSTAALDVNLAQLATLARAERDLIEALGRELALPTSLVDEQTIPVSSLAAIAIIADQLDDLPEG